MSMLPALINEGEKALTKTAEKTAGSALSKILAKGSGNAGKKIAVDVAEKNAVKIPVHTSSNPITLQEAFEKMASARNASQSNARYGVPKGVIDFTDLSQKQNPYIYNLRNNYRNEIKASLGNDFDEFETLIKEYTKIHPDEKSFEKAKNAVEKYLNSPKSDTVVRKSQELLPNAGVYRATWPDREGISWSTSPKIANDNMQAGRKMIEGEILGNERVIAPQFTELYQPATSQLEVIGYPSLQKDVSSKKLSELLNATGKKTQGRGNFGHKGVKGKRGGSAPKLDVYQSIYDGGYGGFSDSVERIGSSDVAEINPETLPEGWSELKQFLDEAPKRVENAIGKPRGKITKSDLQKFLDGTGYEVENGTKDELWKAATYYIDDNAVDELYESGIGGGFAQMRLPGRGSNQLTDFTNYNLSGLGRTAGLDREYSDRLGISRSTTPMSDRLVSPQSGAQGDYSEYSIGTDPLWATGESGVSTVAHERMHSWQKEGSSYNYPEEFKEAFNELESKILPLRHNKEEISKYWGGRKTDYYFDTNEQEARMLQDYLEYKNFTQRYMGGKRKYEYGEEIIKPFDEFFSKLRELSKKGIALPAVALLGLFGLSAGEQEESIDK